ncbi:MAG TPA: hypothetical protein DCM38_04790 [Gammaproteobacteria bacterium]|nr:membrane protein [Beggiatoa sp. SS]HAI68740.1 hypothetical protein [Gammaproteobacteria bacterium]
MFHRWFVFKLITRFEMITTTLDIILFGVINQVWFGVQVSGVLVKFAKRPSIFHPPLWNTIFIAFFVWVKFAK